MGENNIMVLRKRIFVSTSAYVHALVDALLLFIIVLCFYTNKGAIDIHAILLFAVLLLMELGFYLPFGKELFRSVVIDETGIVGKQGTVLWSDVKKVELMNGYIEIDFTKGRSLDPFKQINRYNLYRGKMLRICTESNSVAIELSKSRLSILQTFLPKELISSLKLERYEKPRGAITVYGNAKIIIVSIILSLLFAIPIPAILLIAESFDLIRAAVVFLSAFILSLKKFIERYRDGFLSCSITECGMFQDGIFIPWEEINNVSIHNSKMQLGTVSIGCGEVICINATYMDDYLDKRTPYCIYVKKNRKVDKYLVEHCSKYAELKVKLHEY